MLAVALAALILIPGTASGARRTAPAGGPWGVGTEAVLPSNAATTSQNVSINSVSCSSAGNCGAVGSYVDNSGHTEGLLLTETAGTWATGVEAGLPSNAGTNPFVNLESISCASAGNCTTVGEYLDNSPNDNDQGLLLTQTAGTWSAGVEAVLPGNATSVNQAVQLPSVACPSAGNCVAVGYYLSGPGSDFGLVLTETAGSWSAGVEPSLPANASAEKNSLLQSVSCPSVGNCGAVGGYNDSSEVGQALLLTETAGTWATGVEAALPANATGGAGAESVSCRSAGNCSAVGFYSADSGSGVLLLTETAGSWATGVEATLPANASDNPLVEHPLISCGAAGNCTVIATYSDTTPTRQGVLFSQTSGTWGAGVEAALPADADSSIYQVVTLDSVSCPSAGNCSVVGGYNVSFGGGGAVLLLTENAGSWGTGTEVGLPANGLPANGSPAPTSVSDNSISCASAGQCAAVGGYELTTPGGGNEALLVSTTATAPEETLTLSAAGSGSGTVTSSPAGIDCGATCTFQFEIGSEVTLTGTPGAHSYLSSWSVGSCASHIVDPCQVAMRGDRAVTATFYLNSYTVTVQKSGPGSGTVVSTTPDSELNCGAVCAVGWDWGSQVTLVATPAVGSVFAGWSGAGCSGKHACQLTDTADTTVTAIFAKVRCVVPKVKGKSLASAKASIFNSHCGVGHVKKKASKKVRKGRVISQSPPPGRHLTKGAKVNLVVSKGR